MNGREMRSPSKREVGKCEKQVVQQRAWHRAGQTFPAIASSTGLLGTEDMERAYLISWTGIQKMRTVSSMESAMPR